MRRTSRRRISRASAGWLTRPPIENLKSFKQTVVVALQTASLPIREEEIALVREHCHAAGVGFAVNTFGEGGAGAEELACPSSRPSSRSPAAPAVHLSPPPPPSRRRLRLLAQRIYGARSIHFRRRHSASSSVSSATAGRSSPSVSRQDAVPFSDDPTAYGSVRDFDLEVRDVVINTGAEMIVPVLGALVGMPGLPRVPKQKR